MLFFTLATIFFTYVMSQNNKFMPVDTLDLSMYSGRWYEVYQDTFDMSFQGEGTSCAVADYMMTTNNITVVNSQFNKYNRVEQISGYAYYEPGNSGGDLSVSLQGVPGGDKPYWVISLGPVVNKQYQYSIVSDPKRLSLFVLTRDVETFYKDYDKQVLDILADFGYTKYINKPLPMSQEGCDYTRFDKFVHETFKGVDCGTCGTAYQTCCIGFAVDGYPCDCHLQEGGTGEAGSNCGDCGTGYAACCIGYAADGYPCQCDVM